MKAQLNLGLLNDCVVHESLSDMYLYVCEQETLDIEQVEGLEYAITMKNGLWASVDDRGFVEVINGCVYDYISDFEL